MRLIRLGEILVCCATLLLAHSASAAVYKWTDAQGRVHYSAHPPADRPAATVNVRSTPASNGEEAAASDAAATPATKTANNADEDKARQERREALRKNCEIARQNLAVLQDLTHRRIRLEEGKDAIYLTDEQREEQISKAKAHVQEFCIEDKLQQQEGRSGT